jgi:hypothetical protein
MTLDTLFNDVNIINAVIDRVMQSKLDSIYWQRYLSFEETKARVFKQYAGTVTGVTAGSVIGKNSNKPLRERSTLGSGYGEVAFLGDRYQLDNDRLDFLAELVNKYNAAGPADQKRIAKDIVDYVFDDYRQVVLAPHKRMDIVVGDLISTGKASVKLADNPQGIELLDIELPVHKIAPVAGDKSSFLTYLKEQLAKLGTTIGTFVTMEMSLTTFTNAILGASEFKDTYKMILGSAHFDTAAGLLTDKMANQVLMRVGLPNIRIVQDYVQLEDGSLKKVFADNRIALLQSDSLGKMMWHQPYEATDPVPNKSYSKLSGGQWISSERDREGRYLEYGCEWIPNIIAPQKHVLLDLDTMLA